MRLGLSQHLRTEQRLVQSPQMIQAMKILQCPMFELQDQIEQELQENVFLELKESTGDSPDGQVSRDERDAGQADKDSLGEKLESEFNQEIEQLEQRVDRPSRVPGSVEESDRRLEALYNTPARSDSLADHLLEQVRIMDISEELYRVVEHVVFSLNMDGRLKDKAETISADLLVPIPLAEEAIALVRRLDPPGVGASDLRDCLLLQLDRMSYVRPLTKMLVENHLDALAMNKLPKIAKETGAAIEEIKESWEFLRIHLNPHPGSAFSQSRNSTVVPDVIVDEVDGRFEVRTERGSVPELAISSSYRSLLKEARTDPKVYEYLRRKIDSAKWFIEAVHQRQSTIQRIASEIVGRQTEFLRRGVQHLSPMKMQDVADAVGVH
ncbi:MAG: RNA polymerase factor sigma-54, partial [Planctomycetota bacterium]